VRVRVVGLRSVQPSDARKLVGIEGKDSLARKMSLEFIVEEADNVVVAEKYDALQLSCL
jgi:hypothetical protein